MGFVPDAAPAEQHGFVPDLPPFKPHGRTGGDANLKPRPLTDEEAVGELTGPHGLPASYAEDQAPLGEQLRTVGDLALTGLSGLGHAVAKGAASFGPDVYNAFAEYQNSTAGAPIFEKLPDTLGDIVAHHAGYTPQTAGGQDTIRNVGTIGKDTNALLERIPGYKQAEATVGPYIKKAGDALAPYAAPVNDALAMTPLAPAVSKLSGIVDATRAGNAEVAAARAARRADVPADANVAERLKAAGFSMSPTSEIELPAVNGAGGTNVSATARHAESLTGSDTLAAQNIGKNKAVIRHWGATDIGLPPDAPFTPENLAKAKAEPAAAYRRVADATAERAPVSEETAAALARTGDPDILGNTVSRKHRNSMTVLSTQPMSGQDLMDSISRLREEGYSRISAPPGARPKPAAKAFGEAQLDAANALQAELDARVARTGNRQLIGAYQDARTKFAKIGVVERSLDGFDIDPFKVEAMGDRSGALTGGLAIIADAAKHMPTDVGARIPKVGITRADVAGAAVGGAAGASIAAATGHPGLALVGAGVPATQAVTRKIIGATRGHAALDELPIGNPGADHPLSHYFESNAAPEQPFDLTHPPGRAFEPGNQVDAYPQDPKLANLPVAGMTAEESTQVPRTSLSLAPSEGRAFEAHPPSPGEPGVAAEPRGLPQSEPGEPIGPSHPDTSSRPLGEEFTAPQHQLDLPEPVQAPKGNSARRTVAEGPDTLAVVPDELPRGTSARGAATGKTASGATIRTVGTGVELNDRAIAPGSTVISKGPTNKPTSFIALTPQEDGTLRLTSAHNTAPGNGEGQRQLVEAAEHAASQGKSLTSDTAVSKSQLHAYEAARAKGLITYTDNFPEETAKIRAGKDEKARIKKNVPIITDIKVVKLADALDPLAK